MGAPHGVRPAQAQARQKDGVTRLFPGMVHFKRLSPDRMGWERREDLDGLDITMW
jgi:hypothetical protein